MECHLPQTEHGSIDFASGKHFEGGQVVRVGAPLYRLPLFIRAGAVLPLAKEWADTSPHDATLIAMTVFPGVGDGDSQGEVFFDDGIGWGYRDSKASIVGHALRWSNDLIGLSLEERGDDSYRPMMMFKVRDDLIRAFDADVSGLGLGEVP